MTSRAEQDAPSPDAVIPSSTPPGDSPTLDELHVQVERLDRAIREHLGQEVEKQ